MRENYTQPCYLFVPKNFIALDFYSLLFFSITLFRLSIIIKIPIGRPKRYNGIEKFVH